MLRETSLLSFLEISNDGTMSEQEFMVYKCISNFEGITNLEISEATGIAINAVSGRCRGLVKKNKVKELDKQISPLTGKLSIRWIINNG